MSRFRVEVLRGDLVESVHPVSVAVVDPTDRLIAWAGEPERTVPWRSAAKPFQTLPLLTDGAADAFGFDDEEIALACASHSSEAGHLAIVDRMLAKVGVGEERLACGPHPPLAAAVEREVIARGIELTPRWSNCSGKHTGLVALAKHHGWPLDGYGKADHPVQRRILGEIARFSGVAEERIVLMVDGCATVCFGLPIRSMALAYARFIVSEEPACARIARAMMTHPWVVAGTGRFETELMTALPGEVLAKVGAEGVYSAAVPALGVGLTLKVEDGAWRAAPIALLAVLRRIFERGAGSAAARATLDGMAKYREPELTNTRGAVVGRIRVAGELQFSGS